VGSDQPPDDVRLTRNDSTAGGERRSTVRRANQLPCAGLALDAFDAEVWCERLHPQSSDYQAQRFEAGVSDPPAIAG
jgi:hypothetical protein